MVHDRDGLLAAVRAAESTGEWRKAEALLAVAAVSADPFWRVCLADLRCRHGQPEEALALADAVLADRPDDAAALQVRGAALWRLRRFLAAEESLVAAWGARPTAYAACLLTRVRRRAAGAAAALEWVDRALRVLPGDGSLLRERATLLQRLGRQAEAVHAARLALEASPRDGRALVGWISARLAPLAPGVAAEEISRLLRLPRLAAEPRLHALLGATLERAGRPAEALEAWRSAAALPPRDPRDQAALVFALRRCGCRGEAFAGLCALVRVDPTHVAALAALVADARTLGRQVEVRRLLHALLRADPGRRHLWGWLRRLARLTEPAPRSKGAR